MSPFLAQATQPAAHAFAESWRRLSSGFWSLVERLPIVLIALVVFLILYYVAKGVRSLVRHATERARELILEGCVKPKARWTNPRPKRSSSRWRRAA
jgi:hypothetical protein